MLHLSHALLWESYRLVCKGYLNLQSDPKGEKQPVKRINTIDRYSDLVSDVLNKVGRSRHCQRTSE